MGFPSNRQAKINKRNLTNFTIQKLNDYDLINKLFVENLKLMIQSYY